MMGQIHKKNTDFDRRLKTIESSLNNRTKYKRPVTALDFYEKE